MLDCGRSSADARSTTHLLHAVLASQPAVVILPAARGQRLPSMLASQDTLAPGAYLADVPSMRLLGVESGPVPSA